MASESCPDPLRRALKVTASPKLYRFDGRGQVKGRIEIAEEGKARGHGEEKEQTNFPRPFLRGNSSNGALSDCVYLKR